MGRLAADIRQATQFRATAIDGIRQATGAMLGACATMRGEVMRDYRAQTQKVLASLVRDVAAHRRAATKQVMQVARARQKSASQMRAGLVNDVRSLTAMTRDFLSNTAGAERKMAKQQEATLEAGRRKLGADVAKMRSATQRDQMGARKIWSTLAQSDAPAASKRKAPKKSAARKTSAG
jgi:hypothetical protein